MENAKWLLFEKGNRADLERFVAGLVPDRTARIVLEGDHWEPDSCRIIASAPPDINLRVVYLRGTRVGDDGLRVLADAPALAKVTSFAVERSGLMDRGVGFLAVSPHAGSLRELYLCDRVGLTTGVPNHIGDSGALALAGSRHLSELRDLDLWTTGVGDRGLEALVASPLLPRLESVTVWATHVTAAGAARARAIAEKRGKSRAADPDRSGGVLWCAIHTDFDDRTTSCD